MNTQREGRDNHRTFLNRYYGKTRLVYDTTRKPYLLGRDRALDALLSTPWTSLVEVGFGTGRNLEWLRSRRSNARYGGIDACDAMVEHARARCPWASLAHGFAEDADIGSVHGLAPDRILFSYALSMIPEPDRALDRALAALTPGGSVVAVDFGSFGGMPGFAALAMRSWLARFRVRPLSAEFWRRHDAQSTSVAGTYATIAVISGNRRC